MGERQHQLPPELPEENYEITAQAQKHVIDELMTKIQYLVGMLDEHGLLEEHMFTFPDGDVWKAKDQDPDGFR